MANHHWNSVNRRALMAGAAASGSLLALSGIDNIARAQTATPKSGGTIVYAMEAEPDILDPHACGGWHTSRLVLQMYDQLVEHDLTASWQQGAPPKLVGSLAERWEISPDGLEYKFFLRKGVKFHDGTAFDADAVKYNFDRIFNEDAPQFYARAKAYRAADLIEFDGKHLRRDIGLKALHGAQPGATSEPPAEQDG